MTDRVELPGPDALSNLTAALAALRQAADQLDADDALPTLAAQAELLDHILYEARQARDLLHLPLSHHMGDRVIREGGFELICHRGAKRKRWQSPELLGELAARSAVNGEGEPVSDAERFDVFFGFVRTCLPITPSTAWKTTGLKDAGIDPDEWAEWEGGRVTVRVSRVDPEAEADAAPDDDAGETAA